MTRKRRTIDHSLPVDNVRRDTQAVTDDHPMIESGGEKCDICGEGGAYAVGDDLKLCSECRKLFGFYRLKRRRNGKS